MGLFDLKLQEHSDLRHHTVMAKILFALVLIAASMLISIDAACSGDADCPRGCCLKNVCKPYGIMGALCDLEGLGLARDACACDTGMKCTKVDLSDFGPTVGAVNPIFEKYHYGLCEPDHLG